MTDGSTRARELQKALLELVRCPRCEDDLVVADALRCGACEVSFPAVGAVPCLLPDPNAARLRWQNQLALIHQEGESTIDTFARQASRPGLLSTTRARLNAQIELTRVVMAEVDALLVPAVGKPRDPKGPVPRFSPLETVQLAHRDWSWPESDENEKALSCVEKALVSPLGTTLVLGAGAGRLAYDLSFRRGTSSVVALDIDPLVLLVAERMAAGETLTLTEPRANAVDLSRLSAARTLVPPRGPSTMLPLLANGMTPPVRSGVFDTVLTPWFTDLIPDLRRFVGELRRVLKDGGRWVHFGPLLYPLHRPGAERFSQDELFELLEVAGFVRESLVEARLDYAFSPLTGRGRIEPCFAFSARLAEAPRRSADGLAPWVVLPHEPIPAMANPSPQGPGEAAIAELVDGARSIHDIVRIVGQRAGQTPPELYDGVRACLLRMHPDATL
ncbi:MAG: methyltransferase domain-containing protein [Myxococcota bacterium]